MIITRICQQTTGISNCGFCYSSCIRQWFVCNQMFDDRSNSSRSILLYLFLLTKTQVDNDWRSSFNFQQTTASNPGKFTCSLSKSLPSFCLQSSVQNSPRIFKILIANPDKFLLPSSNLTPTAFSACN